MKVFSERVAAVLGLSFLFSAPKLRRKAGFFAATASG